MATLNDLLDEVVNCWSLNKKQQKIISNFIRENGTGVYSVCYSPIHAVEVSTEDFKTLEEFKADMIANWDEDYYEQSVEDYIAEFNSGSEAREGVLFDEEFFTVEITQL